MQCCERRLRVIAISATVPSSVLGELGQNVRAARHASRLPQRCSVITKRGLSDTLSLNIAAPTGRRLREPAERLSQVHASVAE